MSREHNPIAQLVTQIQQKWNAEVSPYKHINLVRWLIIPQQARLYEGFLRLESTAHGSLEDMVLVMLTPFVNKNLHSSSIIKDWIEIYRKEAEVLEEYAEKNSEFSWDADHFEKRLTEDTQVNNELVLEMMEKFQEALAQKDRKLTLALFPYSVEDTKEYQKWLDVMMKIGMRSNTRFMIFDYSDSRYFDVLMKNHQETAKSLSVPLDLDGAIAKIASAGDPNNPEVQFRKCMTKMSKGASDQNLEMVQKWGERGLAATQGSGIKSLFITAHVVFAGMLFNFKEFEQIDDLLAKALKLSTSALKGGDETVKPLLIQTYGFQASSKQLQKKREDASKLFCKQADTALELGFPQQPLTSWWMAYSAIKKEDKEQYREIVAKAYNYGHEQEPETLKSTCMSFIAADYYTINDDNRELELCEQIDTFMTEIEGSNWRVDAEERKKEMEKRKLSFKNWF